MQNPDIFDASYYLRQGGPAYRPVTDITNPTPAPVVPTTPAPVVDPSIAARNNALSLARLGITQELQRRGLGADAYKSEFDQYLDNILNAVPAGQTDYSQYFAPTLAADVLSGIEAGQRNQYKSQVNNQFGTNYATQNLPDTFLDDLISNTLNEQYNSAQSVLDRGLARGQYNQRGYDAGLGSLNSARQAQAAKLNTIEGDILSGYRSKLGDVRNNAFNAASGYTLGDNFNLDDYLTQASSIVNNAKNNAGGEFLSAVGSTPLFDLGTIGGTAGQAQGAVNLNNLDVRDGLERRRLSAARGRGLGSQGAF